MNLKGENKNEKLPVSKKHKTESRFPDIHSKTGSKLHWPQQKAKEPIRLPQIDPKFGNSHNLLKVIHLTSMLLTTCLFI